MHSATTAACAAVYFYARLAHAVVHISGTGLLKARTVLFTIAWVAFLVYAIRASARSLTSAARVNQNAAPWTCSSRRQDP